MATPHLVIPHLAIPTTEPASTSHSMVHPDLQSTAVHNSMRRPGGTEDPVRSGRRLTVANGLSGRGGVCRGHCADSAPTPHRVRHRPFGHDPNVAPKCRSNPNTVDASPTLSTSPLRRTATPCTEALSLRALMPNANTRTYVKTQASILGMDIGWLINRTPGTPRLPAAEGSRMHGERSDAYLGM